MMKATNSEVSGLTDAARDTRIGIGWYLGLLAYFLLISAFFIRFYQHEMDVDGTSYISLAYKYLAGDFKNAVTGHWAPLISWLMVPFLYFDLEPILAFRVASAVIGIATMAGIDRLLLELRIRKSLRLWYLVSLSPVIAWYAENDVGSDLLCACALIMYLLVVLRDSYQNNRCLGMLSGLMAALCYLAKNYNFYFFFLHFTCLNLCYWTRATTNDQKRTIAANFISAILVFALVGGTWIGLISNKYHKFTVGTAGDMTLLLLKVGPAGYPMLKDGFFSPPNDTAMSAWEDPAQIKFESWSPLNSADDFTVYLKGVLNNISKFLRGILLNYIFALTITYYATMLFFFKKEFDKKIYYVLMTALLYPIGYLVLYYDGQRYIWLSTILLYVLSAYAINRKSVEYGNSNSRIYKYCLPGVLCISLLALTVIRVNRDYKLDVSEMDELYKTSREIAKHLDMKNKNIASQDGNWNHTLDLSYFLKARYFGLARADEANAQLRKELLDLHIQYYFVFGRLRNNLDILKPEMQLHGLTIYKVLPTKT